MTLTPRLQNDCSCGKSVTIENLTLESSCCRWRISPTDRTTACFRINVSSYLPCVE
jgi:hypothetical protein